MHFEAVFERGSRGNWRPGLSEHRDALGGRDRASLEEYLEAINLEAVVREGGAMGAETLFVGKLVIEGM